MNRSQGLFSCALLPGLRLIRFRPLAIALPVDADVRQDSAALK